MTLRRGLWLVLVTAVPLPGVVESAGAPPQTVDVILAGNASPPVKSGAETLRRALEKKGLQVRVASASSSADIRIAVGQVGDSHLASSAGRSAVPDQSESYAISVDQHGVFIEGRDATGAMYGAFDVAEQISAAPGQDVTGAIKAASSNSADARKNGAPGNLNGAVEPMK